MIERSSSMRRNSIDPGTMLRSLRFNSHRHGGGGNVGQSDGRYMRFPHETRWDEEMEHGAEPRAGSVSDAPSRRSSDDAMPNLSPGAPRGPTSRSRHERSLSPPLAPSRGVSLPGIRPPHTASRSLSPEAPPPQGLEDSIVNFTEDKSRVVPAVEVAVVDRTLGFSNLGNTCFLNAPLQCLIRVPLVRDFFLVSRDFAAHYNRPTPVATSIASIVREVFGPVSDVLSPDAIEKRSFASSGVVSTALAPSLFKAALEGYHQRYAGETQHDAQELLLFLLNTLNEECSELPVAPLYYPPERVDHEHIGDTARRLWEHHRKFNRSFVQDYFCGQLVSLTKCLHCGHKSVSCDSFLDISLPLVRANNDTLTLRQCLHHFFGETTLNARSGFQCGQCEVEGSAIGAKRITLPRRCPACLVIHLKRFRPGLVGTEKMPTLVTFPLGSSPDDTLCLDEFVYRGTSTADHRERTSFRYKCVGVVNHYGSAVDGHYTALCRVQRRTGYYWAEFDDSFKKVVSGWEESSVVTSAAYMLVYTRV